MKAISLWQPWATLIACGSKTIETRSWSTGYRGPIAIHAAKRLDLSSLESFSADRSLVSSLWKTGFESWGATDAGYKLVQTKERVEWLRRCLPFGAFVAVAELTDCFRTENLGLLGVNIDAPRYPGGHLGLPPWYERDMGDFHPGRYAWILKNVRVLNVPIPYCGAQGIFEVPDSLFAGTTASQESKP